MQVPKIELKGDEIKKMRDLLQIYSIVQFNKEITFREAQVLSEYLVYGVTTEADRAISLNYNISDNNIKQISSRLQKKGLLIPRPYKQGKDLHEELLLVWFL